MQKINRLALATFAFFLCAQFSMDQDSGSVSGGGMKPSVNFKGTIRDNTGKHFEAEHITIAGLYKQVPVYQKPKNMKAKDYNPTINTVRLDLSEIAKIVVPHPDSMHEFKNRKYIEINVHSKNNTSTKNSYLIENSKKVFCSQINSAGPIERELAFPAIQEITIDGYHKPEPETDAAPTKKPKTITRKPKATKKSPTLKRKR